MTTESRGRTRKSARGQATASRRTRKSARKGRTSREPEHSGVDLQTPVWAWFGAFALAGDAIEHFYDEALKRGEKIESRARRNRNGRVGSNGRVAPKAAKARRKAKASRAGNRRNARPSGGIGDRVLGAFRIASLQDVQILEDKIDALARKAAHSSRAKPRTRTRLIPSPTLEAVPQAPVGPDSL